MNPSHVSLYMTLFHFWNCSFFHSEFYINREEVMKLSKIGSTATYHRCIKQLDHWNYVIYRPSHNPFKGSKIKMFDFGTSTEQVVNGNCDQNQTSGEQALIGIKHKQTFKTIKNHGKGGNFKNKIPLALQSREKPSQPVQFRDNLKTGSEKDYGEPL